MLHFLVSHSNQFHHHHHHTKNTQLVDRCGSQGIIKGLFSIMVPASTNNAAVAEWLPDVDFRAGKDIINELGLGRALPNYASIIASEIGVLNAPSSDMWCDNVCLFCNAVHRGSQSCRSP